jgi:hypothetical protein
MEAANNNQQGQRLSGSCLFVVSSEGFELGRNTIPQASVNEGKREGQTRLRDFANITSPTIDWLWRSLDKHRIFRTGLGQTQPSSTLTADMALRVMLPVLVGVIEPTPTSGSDRECRMDSRSKRTSRVPSPATARNRSSASFVFRELRATAVPPPSPTPHTSLSSLRVVVGAPHSRRREGPYLYL